MVKLTSGLRISSRCTQIVVDDSYRRDINEEPMMLSAVTMSNGRRIQNHHGLTMARIWCILNCGELTGTSKVRTCGVWTLPFRYNARASISPPTEPSSLRTLHDSCIGGTSCKSASGPAGVTLQVKSVPPGYTSPHASPQIAMKAVTSCRHASCHTQRSASMRGPITRRPHLCHNGPMNYTRHRVVHRLLFTLLLSPRGAVPINTLPGTSRHGR